MDIGFVFTNYNNSRFTQAAIESLATSPDWSHCHVVVVDNASGQADRQSLQEIEARYPTVNIIFNETNLGYFPGLNVGLDWLQSQYSKLGAVVVGNNDLVFPEDFIQSVRRNSTLFGKYPIVSPDLITLDNFHQNPHVLNAVSRSREVIWDIYFSNYWIAMAILLFAKWTRRFSERKDYLDYNKPGLIYQGYGACYILGPIFFKHFKRLWAPTFLMGEEFFLSEQLNSIGYKFFYDPSIHVWHHDHASMGRLPGRQLWKISRASHAVYRQFVRPLRWNMYSHPTSSNFSECL
jgi:hypothetical protein